MRIGDPASKHGVAESDVVHAMSNAVRRVVMDEGFTMLIGPAEYGTLWKSASWISKETIRS